MRDTVMKTSLFAATALVGVSVLAGSATAQSAFDSAISATQDGASPVVQRQPAFAVRISGLLRVSAVWSKPDANDIGLNPVTGLLADSQQWKTGVIFDSEREVSISGSAMADNGLSYGFRYDLSLDEKREDFLGGVFVDDSVSMYLSNAYGRIDLGQTPNATEALHIAGESILVGYGHYGDKAGSRIVSPFSKNSFGFFPARALGSTIRYSTPNIGGLTLSASYTPTAFNFVNISRNFNLFPDLVAAAGQYTSTYGSTTSVLYAGIDHYQLNIEEVFHTRIQVLSAGAKVTNGAFSLAAGIEKSDWETVREPVFLFNGRNTKQWDVAAAYATGPYALSIAAGWRDAWNSGSLDRVVSANFNFDLAPGLALQGGITHYQVRDETIDFCSGGGCSFIWQPFYLSRDQDATNFTLATMMTF
jgi:hypothetical protein